MGKYESFPGAAEPQVIEPQVIRAEGDTVTVPDAHLLFSGDFSRSGADLVITGEGQSVVVADYFGDAGAPTLVAPNGAVLLPDVVSALAGPLAPGQYAQVDDADPAAGIGSVVSLTGSATAQRSDGTVVDLSVDSRLAEGDVVQTASGSVLGIVFDDGAVFNLNANSRMVLNELVYEPGGSSNSMLFSMVQGVFAFVAGQVAPTGEMRIDTPAASMGIRGTSGIVKLQTIDGVAVFRVVPDPVTNNVGTIVLYVPGTDIILVVMESSDSQWAIDPATGEVIEQPVDPGDADLIEQLHQTYIEFAGIVDDPGDTRFAEGGGSGLPTQFSLTPAEIAAIVALAGGAFPQIEPLSGDPVSSGLDFGYESEGVEFDPAPPPPPPPQPGSSDPQQLPPGGFTGDDFGSVEEDGTTTTTGQLVFAGGTGLIQPLTIQGTYGTFVIDADGNWVYTLDNDSDAVQSLGEGVIAEETFAVVSADGSETRFVTITVQGVNDVPTVTGTTAGAVVEDGTQVTTGTITVDDPDAGESSVQPQSNVAGTYGTFSILANGNWTYTLNNADPAVQSLPEGETVTDSFTVTSFDGTATETVTITVTGTNDAPEVSALVGSFAEDDPSFSFDLLTGASDIDEGDELSIQGVDETITTTGGRELVLDTHYTVIGGVFALTADGLALFDGLAEGAEDSFVVNFEVTDGIDPVANTLSVTVEGANDAPVILDSSTLQGAVQGDVTLVVHGQMFAHDPDFGDTQSWSIVDGTQAQANYLVTIDSFTIIKNDALLFQDTFSDGTQPPSAPNFTEGNPTNYFTSGEFGESDGRAIMFGPDALQSVPGLGTAETFSMHFATLSTNIDPDNTTFGLKIHDSFTVEARFDLSIPQLPREFYGIRLTDIFPDRPSNDVVELAVRRNLDGDLVVRFHQMNFETNTANVLQTITLDLQPGDNQIDLRLTHDPETPGTVYASFALVRDGIAYSEFHFEATGEIFSDENWTRAQIVAGQPEQDQSVLFGNFGVLSLDDQGQWQYTLANHLPAVQALGEGETAEDTFTIRVTDTHGAYAEETITVTVHGFNSPPVATDSEIHTNEGVGVWWMLTGMDVDSDTLTYSLVEGGGTQNGTVEVNADGSYSYTPDEGFTGQDSFTFRVMDGLGAVDTAIVWIDVAEISELGKEITGTPGNDVLIGGDGNDVLYGGDGVDYLYGGDGDDYLHGGGVNESGLDYLDGGAGNDTLIAASGFLYGGPGNDYLDGLFFYEPAEGGVIINLSAEDKFVNDQLVEARTAIDEFGDTDTFAPSVQSGHASQHDDVVFGSDEGGYIFLRAGDDWLDAGGGDDYIVPGSGNDTIYGGSGFDTVDYGDDGSDSAGPIEMGVVVDLQSETATDGWGDRDTLISIEQVNGTHLADTIAGDHNGNWLNGAGGNDTLYGRDGNDVLDGGDGNDFLVGGAGADQLTGGAGVDRFAYNSPDEGGDIITDFVVSEDFLVIDATVFGGGLVAGGPLLEGQLVKGVSPEATQEGAGQFLYDTSSGDLFWDSDGMGGEDPVHIANLTGAPDLSENNFEIVANIDSFGDIAAAVDGGSELVA